MTAETQISGEYRPGVLAILYRDDAVVLIRKPGRDRDEWYFPAGGREGDEDPEETFFREMGEELGIDRDSVTALERPGIVHRYTWDEEMVERTGYIGQAQEVVFARLASDASVEVVDKDELDACRFVALEELDAVLPFENLRELLARIVDRDDVPEPFGPELLDE